MVAVVAAVAAVRCRDHKGTPHATTGGSAGITGAASGGTATGGGAGVAGSAAAGDATVAAWATWPMPNSTPGLPNPQSFDTEADDVVVDRVTGLMWQRKLDQELLTFADAKARCDTLSLAGHDDWRLPSRIELVSILDMTRTEPSINVTAFPDTPKDWFWSSSPSAGDPESAWYVYFYFGYPKTDLVSNRFSVRCVRTATPHPAPAARYDVQADTVRDVATGLTWQRTVPGDKFVFDAAHDHCAGLTLGGKTGWRVPSMVELTTLIDERAKDGPLIDTAAFPNTPSEPFWSSTDFGSSPGMAWQVYFDHGNALYGLPTATFRVRCVL